MVCDFKAFENFDIPLLTKPYIYEQTQTDFIKTEFKNICKACLHKDYAFVHYLLNIIRFKWKSMIL